MTPDGSTTPNRDASTTGYTAAFTVKNTGTSWDYFYISCSGMSGVTCTGVSSSAVALGSNQQTTVYAYYNVGSPGNGRLDLTAFSEDTWANDNGFFNVPIVGLPAPEVSLSPYNADNQDMSRCAASCFSATYAQSTVPYISLDTPRNLTLMYHGDRVDPKPFVHVNARLSSGSPTAFYLQVKKGSTYIKFLNGSTKLWFNPSTGWARLGAQFDAEDAVNGMGSTGVYDIEITVGAYYSGGGTADTKINTKLIVVNEENSPIARGWTLAGVQRAYVQTDGSVLITEGDGSATHFDKPASTFVSPDGDFSTLTTNGTGLRRTYPDSSDVYFNSSGYMTHVYDRYNVDTYFYYSGGKLRWIEDPKYKYIYLSYGTYGLSSVYSSISPRRYTYFNVDSGHKLTRIIDPGSDTTRFTYDGSSRLSTITNHLGHATNVYYGTNSGKVDSIAAPAVAIFNESGTHRLVTRFAPWQEFGVPYRLHQPEHASRTNGDRSS